MHNEKSANKQDNFNGNDGPRAPEKEKYSGFKTVEAGYRLSITDYQRLSPFTLRELMGIYTGLTAEGLRPLETGQRECTSTFRNERAHKRGEVMPKGYKPVTLINRPREIRKDGKTGLWNACDPEDSVDLQEPPGGWITEFDGMYPVQTTNNRDEAERRLGVDPVYFFGSDIGLRNIVLENPMDLGAFLISASYWPDERLSGVVFRMPHNQHARNGHLGRSETSSRSSEKQSFSEIPKSFGFRESQKALLSEDNGNGTSAAGDHVYEMTRKEYSELKRRADELNAFLMNVRIKDSPIENMNPFLRGFEMD